jgi:hypothetical protein
MLVPIKNATDTNVFGRMLDFVVVLLLQCLCGCETRAILNGVTMFSWETPIDFLDVLLSNFFKKLIILVKCMCGMHVSKTHIN